ncbi:MAG TPA: twin transmembrane helix small protein [Paracoccus sp. (in: a-proteobacteria)]|uniref:twin transmembrane helix small protein n=1 Tax=uncultured Paracoccus sp. TaxID=189685 RepID=UPI002635DC3A|nr:twin transmembrane helix small protein [uncultured Paracoccus sp.]HMQ42032.1 twin transmembrane helix small protein [Paracoccus sp. (in: a-proteobacteria)]HMR36393.1 twin transmembrane helix small protein [Paracoccus sp. (in: a-proteobacteria)]
MSNDPLYILILLAMLAVVVILMIGIGGFGIGGKFNAKHGNRMMRWRIIAQAIAIALILLFIAVRG